MPLFTIYLWSKKCTELWNLNVLIVKNSELIIGIFTYPLKLVKAGEIIGSQKLKQNFFSLYKDLETHNSASGNREKDVDQKQVSKVMKVLEIIFKNQHDDGESN